MPAATRDETVEKCVTRLLSQWREETAFLSSTAKIVAHPAYQELIALGPPALPYLFADLDRTKDGHLSQALAAITGEQPVLESDRGSISKVAAAWLTWARENGYQW